ncbi:MAG: potassium/proton antiporter [Deltaproteobacteria bacterium]|nr:potassium/proton antiporter [Deltaproteobacteria bacterium]
MLPLFEVNVGLEWSLLVAGLLLMCSVVASKASGRLGIPVLVIFMTIGMLAGSEGPGGIYFNDATFAKNLGIIALVFILFAGGLDTQWRHLKPILWPGLALATVGVAVTAALVAGFAHYALNFTWMEALLLGAVVSSTDAAAVFGILRAQALKLRGHIAPLLELESGSNDPMAVFLTVGLTGLALNSHASAAHLAPELVIELLVGGFGGFLIGRFALQLLNRIHLDFDGLYPVLTIAVAFLSYAGIQVIGGNGFLAAYVTGVTVGSKNFVHRLGLMQFHEGLSWLMQIAMFLCLGLLVFPSSLIPGALPSIGLAFFIMFVARPFAVLLSLLPFRSITYKEKMFVSWVGLRGAVPIVLATIPLTSNVPGAEKIFNSVFFIVLLSLLVQGMSLRRVALALGIIAKEDAASGGERKSSPNMLEVLIPEGSAVAGKSVVELELPDSTLLVLLTHGNESSIPRGGTILRSGDRVLIQHSGNDKEAILRLFTSIPK